MANEVALFKAAGLSLANIGQYKAALAKVAASAPVIGGMPILRLDKEGVWRYGQQLTEIEPGSLWAANPLSFQKGFTAWQKGINKPRDSKMKNILSGDLVSESSLPDVGDAKWTESVEVSFKCINGQDAGTEVKYMSNAGGGVERWHELVAQLSHQFEVDPTRLVAVVSLEHDGYFHSDQSFGVRHPETKKPGWVVKPIFRVVDWMSLDGSTAASEDDTGEDVMGEEEPEQQVQQPRQPQQQVQQPTGRRASTIQAGGNGASAPPPAASGGRRQSTIKVDPADLERQATAMTGIPPVGGGQADGVVRRRRRVAS